MQLHGIARATPQNIVEPDMPLQLHEYPESRIEDEPILGPVLQMPDGSVHTLTWFERLMVRMKLIDAKTLASRYFKQSVS
jgi:hypothetical protein